MKALDSAFANVETIVAGDLLCFSRPIIGFTPKCQEGVKEDENVAQFKDQFDVEHSTSTGKSLATLQMNKCSSLAKLYFL